MTTGPLRGARIVEFAAIGPTPLAGMLLADMGADVVRIERPGAALPDATDFISRGRRIVELDLKAPTGAAAALQLIDRADALLEGFRPGVLERLGLGPEVVLARRPALVYARMTGWGQDGPLAQAAGHDLNYIALTGALAAIGPAGGPPLPPLNLVGDYGGGALYLVVGVLAALLEARGSGRGQVVDCAMCDGAVSLLGPIMAWRAQGRWEEERGSNLLDGGAPFYGTYRCADGEYVSIAALEPQFYALLCERAGLTDPAFTDRDDRARWPELRQRTAEIFRTRTRAEWCALLEGSDACFAPVLTMSEAPAHPHLRARGTIVERDGVAQPAPAPRFARTPSAPGRCALTSSVADVLASWS
jgi:alpha-methylacyl-CoA racemase